MTRSLRPARSGLKSLLPRPFGKADLPSEADVAKAVEEFRKPGQLCWMEGFIGNEGFGLSISFNPITYNGPDEDFIEIALKSVSLRLTPEDSTGWRWAEGVNQLVGASTEAVVLKQSIQQSQGSATSGLARTELAGEAEARFPLAGRMKGSVKQSLEGSRNASQNTAKSDEASRSTSQRWIEMNRADASFQLRLDSPPGTDLVRFNPELTRVELLSCPEPSSTPVTSVRVTMAIHSRGELRHSFSIRAAGGRWNKLVENRNKRAVAELLLSKFLKPMQGPVQLWPKRGRK